MMKLYYAPGSCSLSPHIVLCEAGYDYALEKVDLKTHKTEGGQDYYAINEKGVVPYLVLENGEGLSEGVAIVQYLADGKPDSGLVPPGGTLERTRLHEWLNYITSDLHKSHWPLFHADEAGPQARDVYLAKVKKAYDYVAGKLEGQDYLTGGRFTVADAYLFTVLRWHEAIGIDLSAWPLLVAYKNRIAGRPAVQKAMQAEGLFKKAAA